MLREERNAALIRRGPLISSGLRGTLAGIREALKVSQPIFLDLLGMTAHEYAKIERGEQEPSIENLMNLCEAIDLNINLLFSGRIDYGAVAAQFRRDWSVLPERYEIPERKLSKTRSVQTIYHALVMTQGTRYANRILSRLQLHPLHFRGSNDDVSLSVIIDLLSELRKEGLEDRQLRKIGTMATAVNGTNELGKAFSLCDSPRDVYRAMHEELMVYFDRNWRYRVLQLTDDYCKIEVTTREGTSEAFKQTNVGTREGCLCRQGIYASVLGHFNGQMAMVTETECMYLGDGRCIYVVSW